jgi:hypothetical protein
MNGKNTTDWDFFGPTKFSKATNGPPKDKIPGAATG